MYQNYNNTALDKIPLNYVCLYTAGPLQLLYPLGQPSMQAQLTKTPNLSVCFQILMAAVVALCSASGVLGAPQRLGGGGGADKDAVITSQQLEVNFDGNYVNK